MASRKILESMQKMLSFDILDKFTDTSKVTWGLRIASSLF
jgi:hypothetical protein